MSLRPSKRYLKVPSVSLGPLLLVCAIGNAGCAGAPPEGARPDAAAVGAQGGDDRASSDGEAFPAVVDATSLEHKMLFGYQGWFLSPGDGSPVNGWTHWFRNDTPSAANLTVVGSPGTELEFAL